MSFLYINITCHYHHHHLALHVHCYNTFRPKSLYLLRFLNHESFEIRILLLFLCFFYVLKDCSIEDVCYTHIYIYLLCICQAKTSINWLKTTQYAMRVCFGLAHTQGSFWVGFLATLCDIKLRFCRWFVSYFKRFFYVYGFGPSNILLLNLTIPMLLTR